MVERVNEEVLRRQELIFKSYLVRFGISIMDPHALRVLDKIREGVITTFSEEGVIMQDGTESKVTILQMNGGVFTKGTWRGVFNKEPDKETFDDLTSLGFTLNIFNREPATTGSFNGIWRGDGIPDL